MIATYSDLKDKVILVTGAARGIGKAIALALGATGARVRVRPRMGTPWGGGLVGHMQCVPGVPGLVQGCVSARAWACLGVAVWCA